jgi:hypothetical protein
MINGISVTDWIRKANIDLLSDAFPYIEGTTTTLPSFVNSGEHLWSDRFDEQISDLAAGQDSILARMRGGLGISLVEIEAARGLRERPTTPDAFDLILRARSLNNQPPSLEHYAQALALYEQALVLEPNSVVALAGAGTMLIYERLDRGYWENLEKKTRVEVYVARAKEILITHKPQPISGADTAWVWFGRRPM